MLQTQRLILRQWRDADDDPFAAMGQDIEVMAAFPELESREAAIAGARRARALIDKNGWGFWAIEIPGVLAFAGFCGIKPASGDRIEIGWRLARYAWGHGYAIEAARAALGFGWELGLSEIVAFVLPTNRRSVGVATRLGMTRDPADDFDHPEMTPGSRSVAGDPMVRHWLFKIGRQNAPVCVTDAAKT